MDGSNLNSNWLFRAVVTLVTLLLCLWALRLLEDPDRRPSRSAPVRAEKATPAAPAALTLPPALPPVPLSKLPLAALDNTCFGGVLTDLSPYTGVISGSEARHYAIEVPAGRALEVSASPRDIFFDLSLALFAADGSCVIARDEATPGRDERLVVDRLAAGRYTLVVGGYTDHCGPYLLTVRDDMTPAEIPAATAKTGRNGTVVRWTSFAEAGLSHFQLMRKNESGRERVAIVRPHGSPAGFADYRVMDRRHEPGATYELELVTRDGRSECLPIAS